MIGAIAGDIIGSIYEWNNIKTKDFELFGDRCDFTDDTVHTVAVADWLVNGGDLADKLANYTLRYKSRGYGGMLLDWAKQWERTPYNSWGNGSAMRVSPVAHLAQSEHEVLELAEKSASITHSHPDGIAGAQATALTMWMARESVDVPTMRQAITERFRYNLSQTVDEIREWYKFDVSCAGTVPQAITCALEAVDFEDAIRNAVSIGGDTDTVACITGGIAEVMFGIPKKIRDKALSYLPDEMTVVVERFIGAVTDEAQGPTSFQRRREQSRRSGAYQQLKARQGLSLDLTAWEQIMREGEADRLEDKVQMKSLIEAYNRTTFRFKLPDGEVLLYPQSHCRELDRFLAMNEWDYAAVIIGTLMPWAGAIHPIRFYTRS
jgi:ADP-ribosylglycohydrolase